MSSPSEPSVLRLGTRGSLLARTQSQLMADELEKRHPGLKVELSIFKTSGDQIADRPLHELGGKGLFVRELEMALLNGEVDFAVHSFKDVPVTMPLVEQDNLTIAAVPPREDPRDLLVSAKARSIAQLPPGALVGTGSLRRRSQMLALRPDLRMELIRGNIDTRLRKLRDGGQYDAIILAAAGLRRGGLFNEGEMTLLEPAEMLSAPGQGALAVQCHRNNVRARELIVALDDPETERCVTAERMVVAALNGDCKSPIAALARINGQEMTLQVAVGAAEGHPPVIRAQATAPLDTAHTAADAVMKDLSQQNVDALLHGGR
jgi:hydroxymethylbilane synthase